MVTQGLRRSSGPVLGLLLLSLSACVGLLRMPEVEILGVEIAALGLQSGTAEVTLAVTNERPGDLTIQGFLYNLEVQDSGEDPQWTELADGFHDQEISVPAKATREVVIPVSFEYRSLGSAIRSLLSRGEIPYRIRGEVWLGDKRAQLQVPFRSQGVIRP